MRNVNKAKPDKCLPGLLSCRVEVVFLLSLQLFVTGNLCQLFFMQQ